MQKHGICPVDGGKICINYATFDAVSKATHVYCILSQEADSNHEDTRIDLNKIECVTCRGRGSRQGRRRIFSRQVKFDFKV